MKNILLILSLPIIAFSSISMKDSPVCKNTTIVHAAEVIHQIYEIYEDYKKHKEFEEIQEKIENKESLTFGEWCESMERQYQFSQ